MNVLLIQAACLAGFLSAGLRASEVVLTGSGPARGEESGVTTHGTILEIRNDRIVVIPSGTRKPIRYSHGEGTVYVDESGDPITLEVVRSGVVVTVFYSQAEDQRMANRVIVGKSTAPQKFMLDY